MPFSYARASNIGKTPLDLNGAFDISTSNGIYLNNTAEIRNQASAKTTETDSLDLLAPTSITWEQQVINKLNEGLEGEAYNLIMTKLDGRQLDYVLSKLEEFVDEFKERGFNDLANDLIEIISMLPSHNNAEHALSVPDANRDSKTIVDNKPRDDRPDIAGTRNAPMNDAGFYSRITPTIVATQQRLERQQKPKLPMPAPGMRL